MNVEVAVRFSEEMVRLSRETAIKRFLTDVRDAPNTSDVLEKHSFANRDMKDLKLQKDVRAVILVDPDDRSHDFVETAAQSAGDYVRVIDDVAAAIAWLEEEPSR